MTNYSYVGSELELFQYAQNWKAYYSQFIRKYIGKDVLEVGAGIGTTTEFLCRGNEKRWLCLEPDPVLVSNLNSSITKKFLPSCCEARVGTLSTLNEKENFETIIYIDVLEHIKSDRAETMLATSHIKTGGFLIVLAPAHQWLFTPFDQAIGHYRRYNKQTLSAVIPDNLKCVKLIYLDSVGLIASLANRLVLKSKMPSKKQILFWDRAMIPVSKLIDPITRYSVGKSVIGIWQKND